MWIANSLTEPVQEQTHRTVQMTQPLSLPSHEPSWNYPYLVPSNYSFHLFFFCWSWKWLLIGSITLLVFCLVWSCFFFGISFVYDADDSCNHTANQEATRVNKLTSDYEHVGAYMFSSLSWSWWSRFVLSMLAVICFCSRIILKLRLYIARDWYSASSASESWEFSLCIYYQSDVDLLKMPFGVEYLEPVASMVSISGPKFSVYIHTAVALLNSSWDWRSNVLTERSVLT